MKILMLLRHPVDTLICRRLQEGLEKKGHSLYFSVVEKENIIQEILDYHNIPYHYLGHFEKGLSNKLLNMLKIDLSLYKLIREIQPDLGFSAAYPSMGQVSRLFRFPLIGLADTDTANLNIMLTFPLYTSVLTPSWYRNSLFSTKTLKFEGYKELIYAHPNYFKPDRAVLDELGLSRDDRIILMRFSALDSTHDVGLTNIDKYRELLLTEIKKLEKNSTVLISHTEKTLGKGFEKYDLKLHPGKYLDLLAYSTLYFGEGSTSAAEAGILGTPWIFTLDQYRGKLHEQENTYDLGYSIPELPGAFTKAAELVGDKNVKSAWQKKRKKLLDDKIDVGKFLIWFIDNYPESKSILANQPDYQKRFK